MFAEICRGCSRIAAKMTVEICGIGVAHHFSNTGHAVIGVAQQLFSHAKEEGDKSLVSNISYIFSRYYTKHENWSEVLKHSNGIYNDLAFEDSNLARLNTGIALQKLKKQSKSTMKSQK